MDVLVLGWVGFSTFLPTSFKRSAAAARCSSVMGVLALSTGFRIGCIMDSLYYYYIVTQRRPVKGSYDLTRVVSF